MLCTDDNDPGHGPTYPVNPDSISFLFPFHDLEVLFIGTPTSFKHIDNTLIKDIANAWPRLRILQLHYIHEYEHTKVTISGLLPLSNCAYLESLEITLDLTIPDTSMLRKADGSFYNGSLSRLVVGNSPIKGPEAVTSFLSNIFPNLTDIEVWCSEHGDSGRDLEWGTETELWERVQDSYLTLVNVRRQERGLMPQAQGMRC